MDGITELAKMFKDRNNPNILGVQIGVVVSPLPNLIIRLGEQILLDNEELILAYSLGTLIKDDEVILLPTTDNQTFFVLDKAVRL